MIDIINIIDQLIGESENLIAKDTLTQDELIKFKKKSTKIFISLKNKEFNDTINEIADRGLKFEVKKIKNPIYRWIYTQFTTARDEITYNAPFLKKYTESDYNKIYIFRTKQTLEGLLFNLKLVQDNEIKK